MGITTMGILQRIVALERELHVGKRQVRFLPPIGDKYVHADGTFTLGGPERCIVTEDCVFFRATMVPGRTVEPDDDINQVHDNE